MKTFDTRDHAKNYMEKLNRFTKYPINYLVEFDDDQNKFIIIWEWQIGSWKIFKETTK